MDRLYSCLANGSADEFQKGEQLFKSKSVSNALQIGNYYVNIVFIVARNVLAINYCVFWTLSFCIVIYNMCIMFVTVIFCLLQVR